MMKALEEGDDDDDMMDKIDNPELKKNLEDAKKLEKDFYINFVGLKNQAENEVANTANAVED